MVIARGSAQLVRHEIMTALQLPTHAYRQWTLSHSYYSMPFSTLRWAKAHVRRIDELNANSFFSQLQFDFL